MFFLYSTTLSILLLSSRVSAWCWACDLTSLLTATAAAAAVGPKCRQQLVSAKRMEEERDGRKPTLSSSSSSSSFSHYGNVEQQQKFTVVFGGVSKIDEQRQTDFNWFNIKGEGCRERESAQLGIIIHSSTITYSFNKKLTQPLVQSITFTHISIAGERSKAKWWNIMIAETKRGLVSN